MKASAQVDVTINGPSEQSNCGTLRLTNRFVNLGGTLSGLFITNTLPSASYAYLPGETVISLPGGNVLTNALADPSINLGNTNLVWDFSSLVTPSTVTHLLITEVFFNTTNLPKADFEWVELYNPTSNAVSIAGWSIQDTAPGQVDALPPITINPGEFVVVAGRTNAFYQLYPGFTGVVVEVVDGTIGSGLNTFGDGVILLDTVLAPVDAVSYGSSTVAFSPSVPSVAVGRSIARNPADVDTDTRNDWVNQAIPDPGAGLLPVGIAGGSEIVITYSVEMNCDAISGEFFAHAGFEQPPGSPRDESGSAFVTVNNPDIVVIKSPILQSGGILDSVVWNVRVQNAGFGTAPNVVIRDLLGPGLTFTGFSVNPTDSVWGASVTWDASVIPALSNLPAQAFVDITVTAQLTACVGLFNLADATWSCRSLLVLSNNVCEDTAVNNQTASAGVQFVDRFPFLTGSFSPDPLAASYCGGSDVTLYLTNQVAPGSGPAVNIQVESLLPPGWTVTGNQVNSNGTVMLGTLLVGSSTSVVVRVVPGGTCPLELDRQAAYFLASFDDGCGNPFFGPLFVVPTDVEQTPAATITKIMPASVNGDDGSFPVRVELTYSNFVGTESITITDVYPNHPNLIATNSSSGGVISGGSVTWADVVPGPGSGVLTTSFDIVILDPCGGPNSSTLFNQVFASTFSDCLGCDVDVAGSGFFFPIDFDFGSGCGIGGTGGCSYATSKQVSTSLVEVCKPVFISQVVTNFSGTLGDWTGVAFSSDLGGTRGYLDNTNDVVVEVNGSNLTLFVSINVVASNLVIEFDGLNASIYPTLTTSTSVRVTWPVSVSTPGQAIDVSSFSVSSCGSFSRSVLWLVGETDISLSLAPILVAESCGITENQIELFMFESPAGGTERRVFSGYDVEIELNLDQDGNGNSTFSYVPGSTVFSNIVNLAGASLAGFDPVIISNRLVWSLGDIRSNENITVHYQLRADCGSEDGGTVAARLRYNNYCDDDTLPPLREMVSSTINNPPLLSANLINSLQPGLQFLTSTQIVVQVNILNSGGGAAYNLRAEMVLPPNVAFGSAEIAPTIVTSSNVIWEFDTLTGPFGPLTDRDGDTRFDDLPSGPVLQFWLTNNLLSCTGGTDLTLISSYGCDGEVCDEATVYQSTFVSAAGSLVTRATFPAEATLCATNPVEYRVRNSGITVNYDVQAFQVLPLGMQYVTGSSRVSINGGPTNSISDPPGDGSSTNPLTWTLAEIPLLAAMQPNDEVAIFYEVDLGCTARLGNSQFVSLGQFTDTCGNITSNRQVVSVLVINEPGLQLTKEQTLDIGDIGQTNIYTLTLRHAAGSNADVPYMELTDDMPAALTFLGASTPPDAIIGNTLIWSNSTLNALTGDLLPPYQIAEADIVITITAVVNACEFSVVNVAEVNYGCELGDLCDFSRFEISMITTPDIALRVIPDALNLTPCGGIKRVVVTNSGATAFGLVITETAPTGYIFTAASVTGHFNSASAILALSGSPVGKIATIDFTTAAASGAADVADDRGDGLGNLDLGQRSNFAITYTLISDGTTLECLADPTDFDFEDPELDAPSLVLSPTTLTFTNLCLEPGVANRTASVFPDIPDLDIDVQPNSLIVTNGQVINFSVTIINDSETINAGPGVYSRVRLGEGWTDVSYISNWITSSSTTNMTFTQLGNTNLIFDFPDVVLDPIDDRIRLFFTATATDNSGPLDVYGEVAGDCGIPAITPDCVFSNIFGEPPFVDTMTNAVNGQYFSFDQDRFVAAGQTLSKTVRYDNELPSAAGSRRDARIGEALIYRLESTYFGGVFSNVTVRDSLPVELLFGIPTNYTFSGGVTGAVWDANTGVFTLYPTVFTTNPSSFSVDIPIVVSNRIDVQDGIVITNEATTAYFLDGITNIPEIVTAEVPVLEPELNITKLVNSNVVQAGDIIIFTNRLVHTVASRTSAYSIVFTDTLPAGLAFDAFIQPASGQISGQTITFTTNHSPALNEFALGDPAIEFIFSAVVTNQIIGAPIINTSRVTYVSLDNASTNGNERTGDDGPGGLNDYVTSNTATLVSAGLRSISKTYLSSSQTNTIGSGGTNDWTIGERFVYEIRVDIPQGIIITNMIITDVVPAGIDWVGINTNTLLSFPSAGFQFVVPPGGPVFPTNIASGLVITDPDPTPESSTTADGSGQAIVFTIPGVTNIADGIATNDYFLLQMEFVALDMATNVGIGAATRVSNNVVRVRDPYVSLSATSSNYRIVAHDMAVRKDRSPALGDAGDIVTFSLYVTNRPAARANAYDLRVTDVLSSNFYDLSTFSLISIPEGWGWTNIGVAGGMRFEMFSSNNVALPPATGVTGVFQLAIADHVRPNQRFTNRMDLTTATTLYGPPPSGISERNLTANNSTVFAITNMSLAKSLFTTSETNVPPDSTNHFVQIGETLTYRIDVIVPESTITNLTITDFMSTNGLAYIYGSARLDTNNFQGSLGALVESPTGPGLLAPMGQVMTFRFTNTSVIASSNGTSNNNFSLFIDYLVLDTNVNIGLTGNQTVHTNRANLTFPGNSSNAVVSGVVTSTVVEPALVISKSFSTNTLDAGDAKTVTLVVSNRGLATAYDIEIADDVSAFGGVFSSLTNLVAPTGFIFDVSSDPIVYIRSDTNTAPGTNAIVAGQALTFTFDLVLGQDVSPNQIYTNTATVRGDSLDGTNIFAVQRFTTNSASDTIEIYNFTFLKERIATSENGPVDSSGAFVQIGEVVTYRLTANLPEGTITNLSIIDSVPAGMSYVVGSLALDTSDFVGVISAPLVTPDSGTLAASGEDLSISFPGNTIVQPSLGTSNHIIRLTFDLLVLDVPENSGLPPVPTLLTNTASITYENNPQPPVVSTQVVVEVIEPQPSITKTLNPVAGDAGDSITVTLIVTNSGTATAFDLAVSDPLDGPIFDISTISAVTTPDGFLFSVSTNLPNATVFYISDKAGTSQPTNALVVGERLEFVFNVVLAQTVTPGYVHTNTATLTATTIDGTNIFAVERSYTNQSEALLTVSNMTIAKALVGTSANGVVDTTGSDLTIGEIATYRLTVTLPESTITNLTVVDLVPSGMRYVTNTVNVDTTGFGGTLPGVPSILTAGGDGDDVTIRFDGLTTVTDDNNGANNQFVIDLNMVVLDVPGNTGRVAGSQTVLPNSATIAFGGNPPVSTSGVVVIEVTEPRLTLDKTMSPASNALVVIDLVVSNAGLSAAFDVVLEDTLTTNWWDATTIAPVTVPPGFVFAVTGAPGDAVITLAVDSGSSQPTNAIIPGQALLFQFSAQLRAGAPSPVTNRSSITEYSTLENDDPEERIYGPVEDEAILAIPGVALSKVLLSPIGRSAGVGEVVTFAITVTNTGGVGLNPLVLVDTFDPVYLSFLSATGAPSSVIGNTITWTNVGPLLPGASTNLIVSFSAEQSTAADETTNRVVLTSFTTNGIPLLPITSSAPVTVANPGYLLTKDLTSPLGRPAILGEPVIFLLTIVNTGDVDLVTVPVFDTYETNYLAYVSSVPVSDDTVNDGAINWSDIGPLPVGASTSIVVTFTGAGDTMGALRTNVVVTTPTTPPDQPPVPPLTNTAPYVIDTPASLGDFVWNDLNADGIQDGIETGIVGVVVTLFSSNNIALGVSTTDVAGAYAFTNLIPGVYYIDVTIPPGYFVSPQNIGTPDLDSDIDPVTGQSTLITLVSGQNDPTWDAGLYLPASLGDFVWLDTNGNGIQDGGETGVVNVLVTLYDAASNALDTATTDTSGFYTFTNLVPATYFVGFTPPSGLQFTLINQGSDDSLDSDANPITGLTVPTTLISGENDPTWDAGLYAPASLGDFVWNDLNADGIQDGIETGIVGVVVTLFSSNNIAIGVTTTDVAGAYAFTNLIPGDYYIDVTIPPGYFVSPQNIGTPDLDSDIDPVTGQSTVITLISGQNDPTWDAGLYLPASLGDFVWLDTNGNGIQDGGETGVVNVLVTLYDAASNALDTTTTDASGFYTFTNLVPATYFVGFTPPSGLQFTLINQGGDNSLDSDANPVTGLTVPTTLISGENDPTWDAGLYAPASLGDFVWNDLNADGIQDGIETGIVGVVVTLFSSNNIALGVTTTDVAGAYAFTNLIPGVYYIDVAVPPGYFVSPQNIGTPDLDSDIDPVTGQTALITLVSGQNDPTWDAGLYLPASLGDFVWLDTNGNGIQDGGETGVVNVLVTLYDAASNTLDTTTTDAFGFYTFTNLVPATYFIGFTPPSGLQFTLINQGSDNTIDSDANPITGLTVPTTLISGENDPTWDAGLYAPASLGDFVWNDLNADGIQDGIETGIVGVVVTLFSSNNIAIGVTTTDVAGAYAFTNLIPGDYYIDVAIPPGYFVSPQNIGTPDLDSDIDPVTGQSTVITLISGQNDPTWDAGLYLPASLGDFVWFDADRNGIQSGSETGVVNVLVRLYDSASNELDTTTTDASGFYSFTNLVPSTYFIGFDLTTLPADYVATFINQGGDPALDSDADPVTGFTALITLISGENDPTWDMGIKLDRLGYTLVKSLTSPVGRAAQVGEAVTFVIEITNTGVVDLVTVPVTDVYETAYLSFITAVPASDNAQDTGLLTWSNVGPLPSGASTSIVVSFVAVQSSLGEERTNVVTTSPTTPPGELPVPTKTNEAPYRISQSGYVLTKVVVFPTNRPALVGEEIEFAITVENTGDVTLIEVPVTDLYDTNILSFVSSVPVVDQIAVDGSLSWTNIGPILPGTNATISVSFVTLESTLGEFLTNVVTTAPVTPTNSPPVDPQTNGAPYAVEYGLIGNTVWIDLNANGLPDEDLSVQGINGVRVRLFAVSGGVTNLVGEQFTATDAGQRGYYLFTGLPLGEYFVTVDVSTVPSSLPVNTTPVRVNASLTPDGFFVDADFGFIPADPTAVELIAFRAERRDEHVWLEWETAIEMNNMGFNIYRGTTPDGLRSRVNASLVPGRGTGEGGTYRLMDPELLPDGTYYYWLEDVEYDMSTREHGPVRIVIGNETVPDTLGTAFVQLHGLIMITPQTLLQSGLHPASVDATALRVLVDGQEVAAYVSASGAQMQSYDYIVAYIDNPNLDPVEVTLGYGDQGDPKRMGIAFAFVSAEDGNMMTVQAMPDGQVAAAAVNESYQRFLFTGMKSSNIWLLDINRPEAPSILIGFDVVNVNRATGVYFSYPIVPAVLAAFTTESIVELERLDR
jgi:uncharacterized repeat protein (TIGR01451 family)/fimbrial isopeptide formation D2 family protein